MGGALAGAGCGGEGTSGGLTSSLLAPDFPASLCSLRTEMTARAQVSPERHLTETSALTVASFGFNCSPHVPRPQIQVYHIHDPRLPQSHPGLPL